MADGLPDFLPGHRAKVITKHIDVPDDGIDFPGHFAPPIGEHAAEPKRPLFTVLNVDEIEVGDDQVWLIDGLLPDQGFGMAYGPPKSLKTMLVASAMFHVAMGQPWAGRNVQQGAVFYCIGEGQRGFRHRLVAMRRHYSVEGQRVPFYVIEVAPNLGKADGDAVELIRTIREYVTAAGCPPVKSVVIDTLARSMKGAEASSARELGVFIDMVGATRLMQAFPKIALKVFPASSGVFAGGGSLAESEAAQWVGLPAA